MKTLGLLINHIAGLGGSVGLKGTDGVAAQALARGAIPRAAKKTARTMEALKPLLPQLAILTCGGAMGSGLLTELGLPHRVVYQPCSPTSAQDTIQGARALAVGADIIAFAGGDGTARDICAALGESTPVVGIPAGVKIHSPVFAQSPEKAGQLLKLFLAGQTSLTREAEVVDIVEADYRRGIINTRLYGYLSVPFERRFLQNKKAASPLSEREAQWGIAAGIAADMKEDVLYLVGPGSTTRTLMDYLKVKNTLLGVDALINKRLAGEDLDEQSILAQLAAVKAAKLIITPTGGQGYLLGRGNQQISPCVLRALGKENLIVAATKNKLAALGGEPLLVDTGEPEIDAVLRGYVRVTVGWHETAVYPVR